MRLTIEILAFYLEHQLYAYKKLMQCIDLISCFN